MQPAAAEVKNDVRRGHDGVAASTDAVARFQHENGEAGAFKRMGGTEACGAGADDGNIDCGGEGHAFILARSCVGLKPTRLVVSSPAKAGDPVDPAGTFPSQAAAITGCPAFAGHDSVGWDKISYATASLDFSARLRSLASRG